jgi:alpha-ketoglutarate-dependent taurine dioxygenase
LSRRFGPLQIRVLRHFQFWDNSAVMHVKIDCPFEQRRRMNRATIEGDVR